MSKNEQNEQNLYECIFCDYKTFKKNNFERHILTQKHIRNRLAINGNKNEQNEQKHFSCENCKKTFKSLSGIWRHKKKCITNKNNKETNKENKNFSDSLDCKIDVLNDSITENIIIKELKDIIIQQQSQINKQQEQISDLIPRVGNNNTTQNNKFNIQVFLNEKCKDAINMTDFVKSIEVSLEQLDFTKQNGLANGLSKTIIDNINKLSVFERPLHCTDIKRETLYIKDDNEWTKDTSREKIKRAIKKASGKNYNALQDWKSENPDFLKDDSKMDYFTKTISTIGKSGDATEEKIIKNLCKETYIKDTI